MKSIQTKLTVVILIIFLVALSALGGLNYWKARQLLLDKVQESVAKQAENSSGDISTWLDARKSELTMLASAPVVVSGDKQAMISSLASAMSANKVYTNIAYADLGGDSINSAGMPGNLARRAYFQLAVKGQSNVAEPQIGTATLGQLLTVIGVPVKTDGRVTGVLIGAITLDTIAKQVLGVKIGQTGYAYVVENNGLIIFHPDKEVVMKLNLLTDEKTPAEFKAITQRMVQGERGIAKYQDNGLDKMVAFAPVTGTDWALAITVPTVEVTGAVSALTTISVITIVVVLIIAAILIRWFARRIAKPIGDLEAVATRIARGDISMTNLGITSNDETGRLGQSFEKMADNLRKLVHRILGATEQVAASAEELTANAEQLALAANQVAGAITQTAQGAERQSTAVTRAVRLVEQIAAGAQAEAAATKQAFEMTQRAVIAATSGNEAVDTAINQMNSIQATVTDSAEVVAELGKHTKEIGNIVETITNIAGQTNLLALNAAIESARAGEHGRGFAVVAEEVRKLAEDSGVAAKQIAALLREIQAKTDSAVTAMTNGTAKVERGTEIVDKAGAAFKDIMAQIKEIASIAQKASNGLTGLAASSNDVLKAVKEVDAISHDIADQAQNISASTEEQSASMQEIAFSSKALAGLAEDLQNAVQQFKM